MRSWHAALLPSHPASSPGRTLKSACCWPTTLSQLTRLRSPPSSRPPAWLDVMLGPEFETVYGEGPWEEPIWEETLWGGDVLSPPSWAFLWRDQEGHPLKRRFVRFADGVTKKDAMVQAIAEYDRNEIARVSTYNRHFIVHLARRRICKCAKDGIAAPPRVDEEDRLAESDLKKLNLAIDCAKETAELLRDIAAGLDATSPRSLSSYLALLLSQHRLPMRAVLQ
ncbi:hypothetical protein LCI18_007155 [Fusarium solani-melongenae]|uniref:Uncharacterized protein n=1 Tax=Fusarium solani subsp. cucurbitae TaxID=2747967 RepID=A0ACD3Z534_FUSSC|nr:hypothetical protein LCI18_007155 [Fusarium solani-melongenae]